MSTDKNNETNQEVENSEIILSDEFDQAVYKEISKFREDPKSFLDKKKFVKSKLQKDYETFINTLEKLPNIKLSQELCEIAKEEAKKFSEDPDYVPIQSSDQIKITLSQNFDQKISAIIAIDELDDVEKLIPKIISHDKKNETREIFLNPIYTNIGLSNFKLEEENYLVLLFSKEVIKKEQPIENEVKNDITECLNEINNFRENPKSFLEKKNHLQKKFQKIYEKLINPLEKMPLFKFDENLCKTIENFIENFSQSEDSKAFVYKTGEDFNIELDKKFSKNAALIATDSIDDIEKLIPLLLINSIEREKGIKILTADYTHIGIGKLEKEETKYIGLIFAKEKTENEQNIPSNEKEKAQEKENKENDALNDVKTKNDKEEEDKESNSISGNVQDKKKDENEKFIDSKEKNDAKEGIDKNNQIENNDQKKETDNVSQSKNLIDSKNKPIEETKVNDKDLTDNNKTNVNSKKDKNNRIKDPLSNDCDSKNKTSQTNEKKTKEKKGEKPSFLYFCIRSHYEVQEIQIGCKKNRQDKFNKIVFEEKNKTFKQDGRKYKIFYIKMNIKDYNIFVINISINQNKLYFSDFIEINNKKFIYDNIKLYGEYDRRQYLVEQPNFSSYESLNQKINLLKEFQEDGKFMKNILDDFNPPEVLRLDEVLDLLNNSIKYKCFPLFMKDVKFVDCSKLQTQLPDKNFFNSINELISKGSIKNDKNNEQKTKCFFNLLYIYGLSYYNHDTKNFINLVNSGDSLFLVSVSKLISENRINLDNLIKKKLFDEKTILPILIENALSGEEIQKIISYSSNTTISLKLINDNFSFIINKINQKENSGWFNWVKKKIYSTGMMINLPEPKETTDIEELVKLQENILDKEKNNKSGKELIDFNKLIKQLIYLNGKKQELEKLFQIKKMVEIQKDKSKNFDKSITKEINDEINDVGVSLSLKKKISNEKIIFLLQNDVYYTAQKYEDHSKRDPCIFSNFDIHNKNKEGFKEFVDGKNWEKFTKKKKEKFYEMFIKQINSLDDINILFELFPVETIEKELVNQLLDKIKKTDDPSYLNDEKNSINLFENFYIIFNKMNQFSIKAYNFTNIIENFKINSAKINEMYIYILSKADKELTEFLNSEFTKYFIRNLKDLNSEGIYLLIKSCSKNKQFLVNIFDNIGNYAITEQDFYVINKTANLELFELFIKEGYISEAIFFDTDYFNKNSEVNSKIYFEIKDLKVPFLKISDFIEKNKEEFLSRLQLIFCNESTKPDQLYLNIVETLETCKKKIAEIDKICNYLIVFGKNDNQKIINEVQKINKSLRNKNLEEILNDTSTNQIENYQELVQLSQNLRFKDSIFFMKIYEELQKEKGIHSYSEKELFNECLDSYKETLTKIINYKTENFLEIPKIDLILDLLETKKSEIDKEMTFTSNEFQEVFENVNEDKNEDEKITINSVKKTLINFSHLKEVKEYLNSYYYLIKIFKELSKKENLTETDFSQKLQKQKELLEEDNIKSDSVEKAIQTLNEYGIQILEPKKDPFNEFLLKANGKKNEIEFCVGKRDDEIKNLNEFLQDRQSESGNLQPEDFDDFIGCKKFVNEVLESDFDDDKKLNESLKNNFKKEKNLILKFINYFEKYGEIKELYDDSIANKSEITKSLIQKIMQETIISLKKEGGVLILNAVYGEKKEKCDLQLLKDLKNKALFAQNMIKEDEEYKSQITKFNDIYTKLNNLIVTINNLILSGYPQDFTINLKIEDNTLKNSDNEAEKAKQTINKYGNLFKEYEKEIINTYKNKPLMRFFYGPLFLSMIEKIKKNKENTFLLKSISNNLIKKYPENGKYNIPNDAEFSQIFNTINNYLEECLTLNNITIENIFEKNKLNTKKIGLYRMVIFSDYEKNIISLYKQLTGNFPLSNTVLFCNELTSNEEIKAFLYLSFRCEYPVLFCLLNIEMLDSEKRVKTVKLIQKFDKIYGKDMKSCLVIMYVKSSEMKNPLSKIIPDGKSLNINDEEIISKFDDENIEIYTSFKCGLGKTEEIKYKITQDEHKTYIYFPLGGDFTRKEIIERLNEINFSQDNIKDYIIHLDLNETDLTNLLQEVLFKILILKKIDINENVFYFGDLKIKIELPNCFYNYMDKFPILKLFKNIKIDSLLPLRIQKDLKVGEINTEIVAMTLNSFKNKTIGTENIDLDSYKLLPENDCQTIIDEYIKSAENDYNYYQKTNLIKLLSEQLKMFNQCFILDPNSFDRNDRVGREAVKNSREQIISSLLSSSIFFAKGPYDNLIKSQTESQINYDYYDENKLNEQALKSLENTKDNITFDSIKSTLFIFNYDSTTFTAITKCEKGSEEYKKFYDLINTQSTIAGGKKVDLPDYSKGDHYFFLGELKKILGLLEMLFDENEIEELNKKLKENHKEELNNDVYNPNNVSDDRKLYMAKLAKINGNYIYTKDNFFKAVLILDRIQAHIPVILMGETGCGKTSLLKMLSIFMNRGYEKMKTLNIHAGTTENDIIKFMNTKILSKIDEEFEEEVTKAMAKFDKSPSGYNREKFEENLRNDLKKKKIWVFFDELNTCNSMGLIKEIMCSRTMHGKQLPDNLIFLGACNPYRTMTTKMKQSGLTYQGDSSENSHSSFLVYTVNPLPHALMNFIFNFGSLKEDEEREYIKSMIQQNIIKCYSDKNDSECQKMIQLALNTICECHCFIRENSDASAVSLREIRRFNIFFKFFMDYLKNKSKYKDQYSTTEKLLENALNITLYLCYYLRISDKKIREELSSILQKYFPDKLFLEMPTREVQYIAEQFIIDVDKGIALNRSLKENLFTAFVCIVNRIPLIIVGKPGEGKSLTIQTINQTMKGIYSKSDLFKNYPQLYMYTYQGSETSTSQGIIDVFDKARAYAQNQLKRKAETDTKEEKFIAMFFFDEMGLAERSPNNPLKAIHSQLEYDENEFKIAFVGISNWKIDASKMNRCLTLSKPDPDKDDLIGTAETIAKAMDVTLANDYKSLIEGLAVAYYEYKESVKGDKLIENFHGNRDFYNLIKTAVRELRKVKDEINETNKDKILTKIGLISLMRNFGGLSNSINVIKSKFKNSKIFTNYCEDENYNYNILDCIKDNLNDYNSRFLMLVANPTIIKYLESVLDSQGKDYIFLTGSQLREDKKAAEKGGGYSEDLLNKIQYQMSKDCVLILKNLEVIYPSLYELFNQNYIKIGNKYFSKIAFASSKSSSEVHSKLRIILLITQEQLNKMKVDPPLLNRFEKQIVSFKDSLTEKQINLSEKIEKNLHKIRTFNNKESSLAYNLPELLINCSLDEIQGLIYKITNNYNNKDKKDDNEFIENEVLKIIVPTFCQDIIASVKYSGFAIGANMKFANKILEIYKNNVTINFEKFLDKMKNDKNVIYTFSNIMEFFIKDENASNFKEEYVETILSENKVQNILVKFYEEKEKFLIFRFTEKDLNKMNHLSYLINNIEKKIKNEEIEKEYNTTSTDEEEINTNAQNNITTQNNLKNKKIIIFLAHLSRKIYSSKNKKNSNTFSTENLISNIDDSYDKYFIDNLNSEREDFVKILNIRDSKELVSSIINFDLFSDKGLNKIISYFDYTFTNKFQKISLLEYTDKILSSIIFNKEDNIIKFLRQLLIETTLRQMNQNNIIPKLYTSKVFQNSDADFFQVLSTYMISELEVKLLAVINIIERQGFFSAIILNENNRNVIFCDTVKNYIKKFFEDMDINSFTLPQPTSRFNKINLLYGLNIPSSQNWFNKIKIDFIIKEKISEKYLNNENTLRPRSEIKDSQKAIEEYSQKYKLIFDGMKLEFIKNDIIKEIFESNENELKKSLYNDYLNIYSNDIAEKFVNKNYTNEIPIKFIELLLQLKFNFINENQNENIQFKNSFYDTKESFSIDNLSEIFLFLECYKTEITILVETYYLINECLPNTFGKIKEIISSNSIITEVSKRNPAYKKKVNEIFYLVMESILKSLFNNAECIYGLEISNFYSFFDILKSIEASLNKINQKLLLYSNEIYSLRNLLSVYSIFQKEKDITSLIRQVLPIIGKDNEDLQNNNFTNLRENIINIKKIISDKYGENSDQVANYMSNILRQQYRKINNTDYQFELLNLAFENNKLIQRNLYFIDQTIKRSISFPKLIKKDNNKPRKVPNCYTVEECEEYFLSFVQKRKNDRILAFYEKIKNYTFDQVLLYYFELITNDYFNNIIEKYKNIRPDKTNQNIKSEEECNELIFKQNLKFLNKALKYLDNFYNNQNLEENDLNNIGKIYSIAYIKLYMRYFAEIYKYNKDKILFNSIIEVVSSVENNVRKVIKLFFYKNYYQYFENFVQFEDYVINDKEFPFRKEYLEIKEKENSKVNYILNYALFPSNDFEKNYLEKSIIFNSQKATKFKNLNELFGDNFTENEIDLLYCFSANHLLPYYYSNEKEQNQIKINCLKNEFNKIITDKNIPEFSIKLLNKLYELQNNNEYNYTQEQFEIIIYSLRFVLKSAYNNHDNFYYNLLTPQCQEYISNNYIIGTLPFNNVRLKSYYYLNYVMRVKLTEATGFYVCTCGQHYTLGNCTCPAQTFECYNPNCKLKISGTGHKLLGPEAGQTDHWRVVLTEADKIANGDIPCLLFDEYKRRYVDQYLNMQPKGIKKEEAEDFTERNKNIRNLDELSFRLLNWVLYSHLFVSNLIGNLSNEDLEKYTHGPLTCLGMIEKNWELMEIILHEKSITNIKEFMNIIFDDIIGFMKEITDMSTIEKREEFETKIKNYLEQIIASKEEYDEKSKKYNECNEKIKGTNPQSFVEIISENYSPFEGVYSKEEYPYLDMFLISKYPNLNELDKCLGIQPDYVKKYCLTNQVLICNEEYGLIENVININKLSNLLFKKYNNKIERDKAKTLKLIDSFTDENIDEIKKNFIIPYIESWDKIKSKCTKFLCRPDMPILNVTPEHSIIHFIPDDGELHFGMYLASAYRNIIDWQNGLVNTIIDSIGPQSLNRAYLSQLCQEIHVQDATKEDIININMETRNKLKEMINQYSMRNIFKEDDKFNFKEYKKSIYFDFDSIEAELGRQILPGVKKFVSKDDNEPIKFISFLYETFRSGRSSILTNYNTKYPARDLSIKEEKLLYKFINDKKKAAGQNFSKDILSSCQILIDFIQKENFNKNDPIANIIGKLPKYIEINDLLKSFFIENTPDKEEIANNNNDNLFSINTLLNIYNLIELLCWEQFKNNLNDQYKLSLKEEDKKKIKHYVNSIDPENLIQKNDIAIAVRRLISRYLSGKRGDTDISEDKKLFDFIQREDLWKITLVEDDEFQTSIYMIFDGIKKEVNLISQCDESCDECKNLKDEGEVNCCEKCSKCNCGLRIGHSLEFYELLEEEGFNEDKFNEKEKNKNDNDVKENKENQNNKDNEQNKENNNLSDGEELINTNSIQNVGNDDKEKSEEQEENNNEQDEGQDEDEDEEDVGEI